MPCLLKQSKYQKYVLQKMILHNLMTNKTCKNFYSKIPSDLVEKLPTAKNIFGENSIEKYYLAMNIPSNSYKFRNGKREEIYNILISIDSNKTYSIDEMGY